MESAFPVGRELEMCSRRFRAFSSAELKLVYGHMSQISQFLFKSYPILLSSSSRDSLGSNKRSSIWNNIRSEILSPRWGDTGGTHFERLCFNLAVHEKLSLVACLLDLERLSDQYCYESLVCAFRLMRLRSFPESLAWDLHFNFYLSTYVWGRPYLWERQWQPVGKEWSKFAFLDALDRNMEKDDIDDLSHTFVSDQVDALLNNSEYLFRRQGTVGRDNPFCCVVHGMLCHYASMLSISNACKRGDPHCSCSQDLLYGYLREINYPTFESLNHELDEALLAYCGSTTAPLDTKGAGPDDTSVCCLVIAYTTSIAVMLTALMGLDKEAFLKETRVFKHYLALLSHFNMKTGYEQEREDEE